MEYHRNHGVETRIARIFNTYGPRLHQDDGRVISNFIVQALQGKPITVYGDGSQTRSFCYVDDTVEGLIRLMEVKDYVLPVNIGNPQEITIREIGEKICSMIGEIGETGETRETGEISGRDSGGDRLVFRDLPQDDPLQRKPDISRARELLGWNPKISLEEGLQRTIGYFK